MRSGLPLVSIVTPTLNRAAYLPGVLGSVRAQSYPNIEHIVVDGGSIDGTTALLKKEERENGLRWISGPDEGVYDAVNKGMQIATGEILAYLNTDDRYFAYSVEAAVTALGGSDTTGFVYGDVLRFDVLNRSGRIVFYPPFNRPSLHRGALISQPSVFWRRKAAEAAGPFDVDLRLAADIDYWNRLARVTDGKHLDEVLAFEGEHPGRLTSGTQGESKGMDELRSVRKRYSPDGGSPADRIRDRLRASFWYRSSAMRFMRAMSSGQTGHAGQRWQGFRRHASSFQISHSGLVAATLPYIGRYRPDFVRADALPPEFTLPTSER